MESLNEGKQPAKDSDVLLGTSPVLCMLDRIENNMQSTVGSKREKLLITHQQCLLFSQRLTHWFESDETS